MLVLSAEAADTHRVVGLEHRDTQRGAAERRRLLIANREQRLVSDRLDEWMSEPPSVESLRHFEGVSSLLRETSAPVVEGERSGELCPRRDRGAQPG